MRRLVGSCRRTANGERQCLSVDEHNSPSPGKLPITLALGVWPRQTVVTVVCRQHRVELVSAGHYNVSLSLRRRAVWLICEAEISTPKRALISARMTAFGVFVRMPARITPSIWSVIFVRGKS